MNNISFMMLYNTNLITAQDSNKSPGRWLGLSYLA